MSFSLDKEIMRKTFAMGENDDHFTHKPAQKIKIFPFVANNNATIVVSLSAVVGEWLRLIREQNAACESADDTIKKIAKLVDVAGANKETFLHILKSLFWDENGAIRPNSIDSMCYIPCEDPSMEKIAQYLCSVLGKRESLKGAVNAAVYKAASQANVLEKAVLDALKADNHAIPNFDAYYTIHHAPQKYFEDDLKFILESSSRTKEYLIELLEFYYFFYTSQSCLLLKRFEHGNQEEIVPLYFCLDWEKTNKARECYTSGWIILQAAIRQQFYHAITLEILNQNPTGEQFDYLAIKSYIEQNGHEEELSAQINSLTDMYRVAITAISSAAECTEFNALQKNFELGPVFTEIHFLFDSVRVQFESTNRGRASNAYVEKFETFCHEKYLKRRGSSGLMLNITEEMLIFLTIIAIKDEEQLSLNEVFRQFELRGVYLDKPSKDEVVQFYSKLNLIDKKSDSGDAQYVKRIL